MKRNNFTWKTCLNRSLIWVVLLFAIYSCQIVDSKMERKTIDNEFTIDIPVYMDEIWPMEEGLIAQYGSDYHEHYAAIAREPSDIYIPGYTELFIETYAVFAQENIKLSLDDFESEKIESTAVERNGMSTITYRTTGTLPNEEFGTIPVVFYIRYYKGKDYFYIVSTWTMTEREGLYKKNMHSIIESLREL